MDDIALVRLYIDDPDGGTPTFDDLKIQAFLDSQGDAHSAAAELWLVKAANVADWYSVQLDGGMLTRQQVFDHCMLMATTHRNFSVNDTISVLMDGGDKPADETSEF